MAQTRRLAKLYQKLVENVKDQKTLKSYEDWVILNPGYVKDIDKHYHVPVRIAPAGWHLESSHWAKLDLEDKSREAAILVSMVRIEEYETLVPGTIISNEGIYKGIEGERRKIYIESPDEIQFGLTLSDCVPGSIFEKLPYKYKSGKMPVYRVINDGVNYIIPRSELARFYFFVGSKIIRVLCSGLYGKEVDIPGYLIEKETTGEKIAVVTISEGFSAKEKIVLAKISLDPKFKESADFILTSIIYQEVNKFRPTFLQAKFFQQSPFFLGTTAISLNAPDNTFVFVNQVHQTDESPLFDTLISTPRVDHRMIKDEEERGKLDSTKYQPKKVVHQPDRDVYLTDDEVSMSSDTTLLQNGIIQYDDFFTNKEIKVTTPEKILQDKKYENDGPYRIIIKRQFTTSPKTSTTATSLKAALENIPLIDNEIDGLLIAERIPLLVKYIVGDQKMIAAYYDESPQIRSFQDDFHIIDIVKPNISIVAINVEFSQRQFYIFDLYFRGDSMKRTQLIYRPQFGIISETDIEMIIVKLKFCNYSWFETLESLGNLNYSSRGFNHRSDGKDISIEQLGTNIHKYILSHKPKGQDANRF